MNALPLELLHKVLCFLPPRTVYSVMPRVSRTFRDRCMSAIPGCPGDTISVMCELALVDPGQGGGVVCRLRPVWDEFRTMNDPTTGSSLWAAISAKVTVTPASIPATARSLNQLLTSAVAECMERDPRFNWDAARVKRRLGTVILSRLILSANPRLFTASLTATEALDKLLEFGRELAVRELMAMTEFFRALEGFPAHFVMPSVQRVIGIGTLPTMGAHDDAVRTVANILLRFPRASSLEGDVLLHLSVAASSNDSVLTLLRTRVPDARLGLVRSLMVGVSSERATGIVPWRHVSTTFLVQYFTASRIFPCLDEIGALHIVWDNIAGERMTTTPLPSRRVNPLSGIRVFHVRISNSQRGMIFNHTRSSPQAADQANLDKVRHLVSHFPSLRRLVVDKPMPKELTQYVTRPGSSACHMGKIFSAFVSLVPATCVVEIPRFASTREERRWLAQETRKETWPEVLRGWDGSHGVTVVGGKARFGAPG
ncbi:hypothetical protein HDU93_004554 [Gonapodya sp. JEL0774]|nr:hypothetical protein HDU93_004554 [Gonapodya sp. JEL0774]